MSVTPGIQLHTLNIPSSVPWLEYQSRLVTQSLRPGCDEYHEPYDELGAKADWGMKALDAQQQQGDDEAERENDDGNLAEVPWLIWEQSVRNRGKGDCLVV